MTNDAYKAAGVDINAGDEVVRRILPAIKKTHRSGSIGALGGFGAVFDPKAAGYSDPLLVSATDGVGTKLKVAIETGIYDSVGIDLVAMCVNDLIVQGAEPLFFLDYFASGKTDPARTAAVIEGIAKGCEISGCTLSGGETAEMPGMYADNDFDLAGFTVGAVERERLITNEHVQAGDVLLGLASDGIHSNGFSLVRKIVSDTNGLNYTGSAPYQTNASSLGEDLLTPTRIYVKPILSALAQFPHAVHGMAHITGGGLLENIPRSLPDGLSANIDCAAWDLPPVFKWLKQAGNLSNHDLSRTLNTGIGYVLIVAAEQADDITAHLTATDETVYQIGIVEQASDNARVIFENQEIAWGL